MTPCFSSGPAAVGFLSSEIVVGRNFMHPVAPLALFVESANLSCHVEIFKTTHTEIVDGLRFLNKISCLLGRFSILGLKKISLLRDACS